MSKENTVDRELFVEQQKELERLRAENETYRQRSPLVGVRWYGEGGYGIGLTNSVNGKTKVALQGYGAKDVIDYATWVKIRNNELVQAGLVVRDDTVIDEMQVVGTKAEPDKDTNLNAYTDEQILAIFKKGIKAVKDAMNGITVHYAAQHFLTVAKKHGIKDIAKIAIVRKVRDYLATKFRWDLTHDHDLKMACDQYNLEFVGRTREEIIEDLVRITLAGQESDEFE